MKLWTIQHEDVWKELQTTGILKTNTQKMREALDDTVNTFETAYKWMVSQMCNRIGEPPQGVEYPVWAWYMWEGKRRRRDMRGTGLAMPGTPIVQMTIEVPDELVLLSDFDAWHSVLNKWYIPDSKQDDNEFEKGYILAGETWQTKFQNSEVREKIIRSWNKIFKPNELSGYISDGNSVQATFWELKLEQIIKVEHFIARGKKY